MLAFWSVACMLCVCQSANVSVSGDQGPGGKRSWHNILEAAGQTRPTLLETVYGLDVIIPGER